MSPHHDLPSENQPRLSPSQVTMLRELAKGKTPEQIAAERGIRRDTVYQALEEARKRLKAKTTCEMVSIVTKHGLVDPDGPGSSMVG